MKAHRLDVLLATGGARLSRTSLGVRAECIAPQPPAARSVQAVHFARTAARGEPLRRSASACARSKEANSHSLAQECQSLLFHETFWRVHSTCLLCSRTRDYLYCENWQPRQARSLAAACQTVGRSKGLSKLHSASLLSRARQAHVSLRLPFHLFGWLSAQSNM